MNSTIILIGPLGAGKSTIGHLLAEALGLPLISIDDVRWMYFEEMGYDKALAAKTFESNQGVPEKLSYSSPFEAGVVERVLTDHKSGIIDFGASNSVYEDELLFARVEKILAPYPNVILLLPSPDPAESVALLNIRLIGVLKAKGEEFSSELSDFNTYFVKHPSNQRLAKLVIYTKGKTPEEIRDEIIQKLL